VNTKLEEKMVKQFNTIWAISMAEKIDLRSATYMLSIGRIVDAMKNQK
jgi:glutamate dehydrogenase/leucine dehydrogenase